MVQVIITYTPMYVTFIWSLVLLSSAPKNQARLGLGVFMFVTFLLFLTHAVYYNGYKEIYLYFDLLFVFSALSVYPLYYWYIKLLTVEPGIRAKDIKLLIPAICISMATFITYLLMTPQEQLWYINHYLFGNEQANWSSPIITIQIAISHLVQFVYLIQIITSIVKIRKYITEYNDNIANFYSNLDDKVLEWPKVILNSFIVMSAISIIVNFLGRTYFFHSLLLLSIPSFGFSILLCVFGFLGNMQNHTLKSFSAEKEEKQMEPSPQTLQIVSKPDNEYLQDQIKAKLILLFDKEKIYKDKELKITEVASRLYTNRTYVSNLINNECKCSFSAFVNQYRVKEAKVLLSDPQNNNFSLEHIADLAGFGSLHSLIRAFKELERITPGRYRESIIYNSKVEKCNTPEMMN